MTPVADVAQLVEHILGKDEVRSSNLRISSTYTPLTFMLWSREFFIWQTYGEFAAGYESIFSQTFPICLSAFIFAFSLQWINLHTLILTYPVGIIMVGDKH
jgi:hypothetical protein